MKFKKKKKKTKKQKTNLTFYHILRSKAKTLKIHTEGLGRVKKSQTCSKKSIWLICWLLSLRDKCPSVRIRSFSGPYFPTFG